MRNLLKIREALGIGETRRKQNQTISLGKQVMNHKTGDLNSIISRSRALLITFKPPTSRVTLVHSKTPTTQPRHKGRGHV